MNAKAYQSLDDARRSFEIAQERYIQAVVLSEPSARYRDRVASVEAAADTVRACVDNLAEEERSIIAAIKAYARRFPHRVDDLGVQRPSLLDKAYSAGRASQLYREILSASARRLKARKASSSAQEAHQLTKQQLQISVDARKSALSRSLRTPNGLAEALQRDPLFNLAYMRLREAVEQEPGISESASRT